MRVLFLALAAGLVLCSLSMRETNAAIPAVVLVIDEDSIDNGNPPNFFSDHDVNDDIAEIGVRQQLRYFANNPGATIWLNTGQKGDEGWFRPDAAQLPASWAAAGPTGDALANFVLAGPGLGTANANGDREALLDKIPGVQPQRATQLAALVGETVCAVVFDSDVSVNYKPLEVSLKGANLGVVSFRVLETKPRSGSNLPAVKIEILDAATTCADDGGADDDGDPDDLPD